MAAPKLNEWLYLAASCFLSYWLIQQERGQVFGDDSEYIQFRWNIVKVLRWVRTRIYVYEARLINQIDSRLEERRTN